MENNDLINEDLEEHNSQSELPKKTRNTRRLQAYAILFFGAVILLVLVFFIYNQKRENSANEVVKKDSLPVNTVNKKEFKFVTPTLPPVFKPTVKKEEKEEEKPFYSLPQKALPTPKARKEVVLRPKLIKGSSKALVKDVGKTSTASPYKNGAAVDGTPLNIADAPELLGSNPDYVGDTFTPTSARMSKFNPSLLLPKGTFIGCSLNTRVISDIAGGISCTVSDSVYSSDGKVLLVEKGSKINGTFKNAQMNDGMNRIFVIWQEIRTPNHLVIPVFSGATDELGGSGLEGEVNHKWLLRFGSAVLLSAIDDIFNVLAYNLNGKEDTSSDIDYSENTRENAKSMSSIALEQFINIKPTLYKNQGDLVGVYVNRDIDFSKVYRLRKTTARLIK